MTHNVFGGTLNLVQLNPAELVKIIHMQKVKVSGHTFKS